MTMRTLFLPLPVPEFHIADDGQICVRSLGNAYALKDVASACQLCRATQKIYLIVSLLLWAVFFPLSILAVYILPFSDPALNLLENVTTIFIIIYLTALCDVIIWYFVSRRPDQFGVIGKAGKKLPKAPPPQQSELHNELLKNTRMDFVITQACFYAALFVLLSTLSVLWIRAESQLDLPPSLLAEDTVAPVHNASTLHLQSNWGKSIEKDVKALYDAADDTTTTTESASRFQTILFPLVILCGLLYCGLACGRSLKILALKFRTTKR